MNNIQRALLLYTLPTLPDGMALNDPYDAVLLSLVLTSEADYLVTEDRRAGLLQRSSIGRTRIVAPATCCAKALWSMPPNVLYTP